MQAQRIKFLQDEIENFPEDPFNFYALAMEYRSSGNPDAAGLFEKLLQDFPNYLPTYYQAATYFFEAEQYARAETVFQAGIALAGTQGNEKALKELNGSYSLFKSETEDDF
jgi:tetratricopeptide (TPR) repeat protein